ncbi:MAG: hypothetical protein ACLFWF_12095, partial [Alphaproteobacteria bacterium]
ANPGLTKLLFSLGAALAVLGPLLILIGGMASGVSALIVLGAKLMPVIAFVIKGFGVLWTGITALVPAIGALIKGFGALTAAMAANPFILIATLIAGLIVAGILLIRNWKQVSAFIGRIWRSITSFVVNGVRNVTKAIFGVDLVEAGAKWIGGLWEGIRFAWAQMTDWLTGAIEALLDFMPDWVKEQLGISTGGAPPSPDLPRPQESAIQPGQSRVGGRVTVEFENAPKEMRVRKVRSETPGFEVDTDAGYAMVTP